MGALILAVGAVLLFTVVVAIGAVLGGTIVWFLWPDVMVAVFHFPPLTWWQAVALTWICAILLKSSSSSSSKK